MDNDDGHPANADGLSSDDGAVNVSTLRASIPDADDFRGDNDLLRLSIAALLELDAAKAIAPHPIGGHARRLLAAAYHRLPQ